MGRVQMILYGTSSYIERLGVCIQKHKPDYLELLRFQELSQERIHADILLREEGTDMEVTCIERTVDICLYKTKRPIQKNKETSVFCYQKGQEILRQVFQVYQKYATELPGVQYRGDIPEMTVFYSPEGHERQLFVSMAYAVQQGLLRKVLYLNIGTFSGMSALLNETAEGNFSDLFYAVQQRPERFAMIFQGLLHHNDYVDYLYPPENPSDLFEVRETDLAKLVDLLAEQTEYELIVWNSNSWNPVLWQLLQQCGKIYVLQKESSSETYCIQEMQQFLGKEVCAAFREKVRVVSFRFSRSNLRPGESVWEQLRQKEWTEVIRDL